VESNTVRDFTLYQFLSVWGESIDYSQIVGNQVQTGESACILANGQTMQPTDVLFIDQQKIVLEIISSSSCNAIS
jgi:hypothetical protein